MLKLSTAIGCASLDWPATHPIIAPKTTRIGIKIVDKQPEVTQRLWWKKLHDPVLNHLIKVGTCPQQSLQKSQCQSFTQARRSYKKRVTWCPPKFHWHAFVGSGWESSFYTLKGH